MNQPPKKTRDSIFQPSKVPAPAMLSGVAIILGFAMGCGAPPNDARPIVEVPVNQSADALIVISAESETCATLFAGQTINSGTVCVSVDNSTDTSAECGVEGAMGSLLVEYATIDGWELTEAHLAVGDDLSDIPTNKKGNPKIGNFPYNSGDITGATSHAFSVPLCTIGLDAADTVCDPLTALFAAHAAVRRDNGDGTFQTETGWGNGDPLVAQGSWAEVFNLTLECVAECVPEFDEAALEAELDEIDGTSEEVGLQVFHQGGSATQPYFRGQLDYDHDGVFEQTDLPMFCIDLAHSISSGTNYCSRLYSSYDGMLPSDVQHPENLDLVNYILNNFSIGDISSDGSAFTGGDFQRTFWSLIYGQLPNAGAYASGPSSDARVQELLDAASAQGEAFEPPCDGVVAVLVYPVVCEDPNYTISGQVLVAQMLMTEFEASCSVCEPPPPVVRECETAFAMSQESATCFIGADFDEDGLDDGISRWGWSNGPLGPGSYSLEIFAGAGQCDTSKGTLVGTLQVDYDGSTATVTYTLETGFALEETHLYVGNEPLARDVNGELTVAPGQYDNIHDLEDGGTVMTDTFQVSAEGELYVVAHAVVCSDVF